MARSCVTDPRWRELVALYRYDWIAAADVLFGKTPTWQQDLIIESVQEQGSKTSVSSGHGTGKSDMTSIMIMLFIIMYPGARAIIVANKIQQVIGFAPIFPDICYHLTHYKPAAADIPVASDNPAHYADAIRYNARTPLQGSLLPLTRLVWA